MEAGLLGPGGRGEAEGEGGGQHLHAWRPPEHLHGRVGLRKHPEAGQPVRGGLLQVDDDGPQGAPDQGPLCCRLRREGGRGGRRGLGMSEWWPGDGRVVGLKTWGMTSLARPLRLVPRTSTRSAVAAESSIRVKRSARRLPLAGLGNGRLMAW